MLAVKHINSILFENSSKMMFVVYLITCDDDLLSKFELSFLSIYIKNKTQQLFNINQVALV